MTKSIQTLSPLPVVTTARTSWQRDAVMAGHLMAINEATRTGDHLARAMAYQAAFLEAGMRHTVNALISELSR